VAEHAGADCLEIAEGPRVTHTVEGYGEGEQKAALWPPSLFKVTQLASSVNGRYGLLDTISMGGTTNASWLRQLTSHIVPIRDHTIPLAEGVGVDGYCASKHSSFPYKLLSLEPERILRLERQVLVVLDMYRE
jgi:hypothetical protein